MVSTQTRPPEGSWSVVFDGGGYMNLAALTWNATVPAFTLLDIQVRLADSVDQLCGAFDVVNGTTCSANRVFISLQNGRMVLGRAKFLQVCTAATI